jgi:hypothetical protein
MGKMSNENKIFKLFSLKTEDHNENTEIKETSALFMNSSG